MRDRVNRLSPTHRAQKLELLLKELRNFWTIGKFEVKKQEELFSKPVKIFITRYRLRQLVSATLNVVDHVTIRHWIDYLVGHSYLNENPTSHISRNGRLLPTNDTRYFIQIESINEALKVVLHPLTSYCGSPDHQEDTKDNLVS